MHKDFFKNIEKDENFVGYTFKVDFEEMEIITNDKWKLNVQGISHGSFLIAMYDSELGDITKEGILLRVLGNTPLPQDMQLKEALTDVFMDMSSNRTDYNPDIYTKNWYQFSGLKCRALGTFFIDNDELRYGTDLENIMGPHKYKIFKPKNNELEIIVNSRSKHTESKIKGTEVPIAHLKYSSSRSYTLENDNFSVPIFLKPQDILSRRTAFFGMTRTGKSNTIKIAISAILELNKKLIKENKEEGEVGQIVFDINGEYSFPNTQDDKSIFEKYPNDVVRYTTAIPKIKNNPDVQPLQFNFYDNKLLMEAFNLLKEQIILDKGNLPAYLETFFNIDFSEDYIDNSDLDKSIIDFYNTQRWRKIALYKCILFEAKFQPPSPVYRLNFKGVSGDSISSNGLDFKEAISWFKRVYERNKVEEIVSSSTGLPVFDNEMVSLMDMLLASGKSGYKVLMGYNNLHSNKGNKDFKSEIDRHLRNGKIVLVDLSTASEDVQNVYITKLCKHIFNQSMKSFTEGKRPASIQLYFEEAHNIFPKDDKDLKNIYNRLAKEGAKLHLGISYSTQEVSSISPSILKNTNNWFISHLNNIDEIKILSKYYDFMDFSQSILKNTEVGFARIKMHSNDFTIPVKINKF